MTRSTIHTARSWITTATRILGLAAALTAAAAPAESTATDTIPGNPLFGDRFIFEFGGYYSRSSTQASLSGLSGGAGVAVDFESAFGLEQRNRTAWVFAILAVIISL